MAVTENSDRLVSLDVFRGITIAGMTLVNNPGTWSSIYGPLKHAEWHGITPTDYIFPFFLFIVGVAIPISFAKRTADGVPKDLYYKIFSRGPKIFLLGIVIYAIPFFKFGETDAPQWAKLLTTTGFVVALYLYLIEQRLYAMIAFGGTILSIVGLHLMGTGVVWQELSMLRIPGVLQRIAVCYVAVSLIFLNTRWTQQLGIGVFLLLGYWLVMTIIPVPGCEVTTIDQSSGAVRGPEPLQTLSERFGGNFGIYYRVARAGRLRRGEDLQAS